MRKISTKFWIISALALGFLVLRLVIASRVHSGDMLQYKSWLLVISKLGLTSAYEESMDYPPLYAYILWCVGRFYSVISLGSPIENSPLLSFLVQIPPFMFDVFIGCIFYFYGRALENGRNTTDAVGSNWSWRYVLPALYLMNPAILFFAYWGLVDSVHITFILSAFISLASGAANQPAPPIFGQRSGPALAWIFLSLATLMKPLALPFWPLLAMLTLIWSGLASIARGMLGAGAAALLVLGPFAYAMGPIPLYQRLSADFGSMPFMSVNAHNIWWVLGGWRNAEEPWLGLLTATQVGIGLFGLFLAALLIKGYVLHRRQLAGLTAAQGLLLAWLVGIGFFMLSTHLHEHHLLIAIPLLLPVLPLASVRQRTTLTIFFSALTIGVLLNGVLQNSAILAQMPFSWGGAPQHGIYQDYLQDPILLKQVTWGWGRDQPYPMVQLWALRAAVTWNIVLFLLIVAISFWPRKGLLDSAIGQAVDANRHGRRCSILSSTPRVIEESPSLQ
jgi:hypothetical protein